MADSNTSGRPLDRVSSPKVAPSAIAGKTAPPELQSSSIPRERYAREAAARFEQQLALIAASEYMAGLGNSVVDGIRSETRAAYQRHETRWDGVSSRAERALIVASWVAGLVTLGAFAWWAEGPPVQSRAGQWLWAAVAPLAGLFWLGLLLAPLSLVVPRFTVRPSAQQSATEGEAAAFQRLPVWARVALKTVVFVCMLILALWVGRSLFEHWPKGVQGMWAVVVLAVAFVMVIAIVAVVSEMASEARVPSDFRDEILLSLFDCISVARFGIVIRDLPERDDRAQVSARVDKAGAGSRGASGEAATANKVAAPSWRTDPRRRLAFVARLNNAAKYAERDAVRLAPRSAPEVREDLRDYGRRVAAGFQKHAAAVALGGKAQDEQIVEDLEKEYAAAGQGQWFELGTVEAARLTKRLIVQIAQRIAVVGALVAAALVVAPLVVEGAAQAQVRGALLGAAVLAFIAPRDAVNDLRDQAYRALSGRGR